MEGLGVSAFPSVEETGLRVSYGLLAGTLVSIKARWPRVMHYLGMTEPVFDELVKGHHEAGHVVVGWVRLDLRPVLVTIEATPEFEGRCEWQDRLPRFPPVAMPLAQVSRARNLLAMLVAGEVAARKFAPELSYWGQRGDEQLAADLASTIAHSVARPNSAGIAYASPAERDAELTSTKAQVSSLLDQGQKWALLVVLANAIAVAKTLDEATIIQLAGTGGETAE